MTLSVVILSYNTKEVLRNCLRSLNEVKNEVGFEVIIPDNGSGDGSPEMVELEFPWVTKVIKIGKNLGFAAGNNYAKPFIKGKYVLFLNPDTLIHKNTLKETVKYMESNKSVGALTCKLLLPNGELDKDARRSFITPWVALIHIYLKLDRIFPKSKLFAKYWYGYLSPDLIHEVDALQGAFFLTRKVILDSVGWFDEAFFLDGEDLDLCWRIKGKGWKIMYYPKVSITHFKGLSKGKVESRSRKEMPLSVRLKYRMAGVNSMELFYRKHLWNKYPFLFNVFVLSGINLIKVLRFMRTLLLG
ncbi:hypothetical protein A3A76_03570 [Candidatus Woesebacteria bacterium RIFCSPLOWO2_01_FULL_39_23]|uniref:Uncharacterized protein n=1 Tax=Candidatus Woesebacteria bacterium RIFCSPHIGHO2_01_FULL_40_22 TaxID=1802499 RepID=A0A1F7YK00_9BACT|nr:MAG: hypothetical protein A2141_00455 [Candidatus Woesebacteria bacterium RBG_16_40_11]OGM27623.1 MAG: hypothetical protein A2628_01970 [Candidatus Woesebacteria bacterium RIFCSPHIGHO2_01_FULL_40_22]OGM36153.1 MAG: hypothetical protein A3E41_02210 [Candidatus Woesebacteria bacterium RIFCSPHIGHO2_12_FULL_38_9]OGM62796.1 MAG: hypothetical protein A3A76_03570 [Candidatus Woesebacteria bacterium RIFCSPLOWO2_01_FULL_39_23]